MIQIGCPARYFNPYEDEVRFAEENGFGLMQIWYDKNGIGMHRDENPIESIRRHGFPSIIHAVLDINRFEEHIPKLVEILRYIGHREIIIHPLCKSEEVTPSTIYKLCEKAGHAYDVFSRENITLYMENNSRMEMLLNSSEDVEILFGSNPGIEFLLDVAHIDDYEHLKRMVKARKPGMLHIADRHLEVVHEHLPIGEGNIDYRYIFEEILNDFDGRAILEIVQSSEDLIKSRLKIEEYYLEGRKKKK